MNEVYNREYYRQYGPVSYENAQYWNCFFENVADHIVSDLNPKTVLDAGCAMGYLVAALRDRGVEAYGIDISSYAISQVREDIKPFCRVATLVETIPATFPEKFDLITNFEVLEHMFPDDGEQAIRNLCAATDRILFSSSPDDFSEPTHVNVQQREYWAGLFAKNNFFDDLSYRPTYISPQAICFCRGIPNIRLIEWYEKYISKFEGLKKERRILSPILSKIYFSTCEGESEENALVFQTLPQKAFSERVIIPSGCHRIRFDPLEGVGGFVRDFQVNTECSIIQPVSSNGLVFDGIYLFQTLDSQIFIDLPENVHWVDISAEICPVAETGWLHLYQSILSEVDIHETIRRDLAEEKQQNRSLKEKLEVEHCKFENSENECLEYKDKLKEELVLRETMRDENVQMEMEIQRLNQKAAALSNQIADYSNLVAYERTEAQKVSAAYLAIVQSVTWRATKPVRSFVDVSKRVFHRVLKGIKRPISLILKIINSIRLNGVKITAQKVVRRIKRNNIDTVGELASTPVPQQPAKIAQTNIKITGNPIDKISTVLINEPVKRINLVTDTINSDSLLGGVATALIVATEFANRYNYELRIITRNTETNALNYENILKISGIKPAKKVSFFSDYQRNDGIMETRMEISPDDVFFATSWWSARAIEETTIRSNYFYIIQEVETFFYNHGGEHLLCQQMMEKNNIDYIINSEFLYQYFKEHEPNIIQNCCYFEPAFPETLYCKKDFKEKAHYKLFFYARPNNPRNLYTVGVNLLQRAVNSGILDTQEWDIYCVGQNAPQITFANGYSSINLGQLSWTKYAEFLSDVDLGLCLMYTPHPSYPPFDVACSGGVVLSNKMYNKVSFDMCKNVILSDLDEELFMQSFAKAIELAKDMQTREKNYKSNTICRDWHSTLENTISYMGERLKIV